MKDSNYTVNRFCKDLIAGEKGRPAAWRSPTLTQTTSHLCLVAHTVYLWYFSACEGDSRQMSRRSWCILCAHGVVVRNVAHDLRCSSSSHFPCCWFFFVPLRPRKKAKEKNEPPNHWLQKTPQLNQWPGKVTADHRRVSVILLRTSCISSSSLCCVLSFIAPLCLPSHLFTP